MIGDIWEKRKRPAGQRSKLTLTMQVPRALDQHLRGWSLCLQPVILLLQRRLPHVPQIYLFLQVLPFKVVSAGNGVPGVATKRHTMLVVRGAFFPAIQAGNRLVEFGVKLGKIEHVQLRHTGKDTTGRAFVYAFRDESGCQGWIHQVK